LLHSIHLPKYESSFILSEEGAGYPLREAGFTKNLQLETCHLVVKLVMGDGIQFPSLVFSIWMGMEGGSWVRIDLGILLAAKK
jgi:hypothetical protein